MPFQYLTTNSLSLQSVWQWAKRLVDELNKFSAATTSVPSGTVVAHIAQTVPLGWLACDGSSYSAKKYPELFLAIGYAYGGAGDSFNVPDFRDRIMIGAGSTVGAGQVAGTSEITLSVDNLPSHTHAVTDPGHTHAFTGDPHTHAVTDPGHVHAITDPGHKHTVADPGHTHPVTDPTHRHIYLANVYSAVQAGSGANAATSEGNEYTSSNATGISLGSATTGVTLNNNTTGVTVNSSLTGISNQQTVATGTNATNTTGVSNQNTGGDEPFSILPPVVGVNIIIKA